MAQNFEAQKAAASAAVEQLEEPFPRIILIGAAILISIAFTFAYVARQHDIGATRLTPAAAVESRDLQFVTLADGTIAIRDAQRGEDIRSLAPKSDGFIKIVLRSLAHERKLAKVDMDAPVRLSRLADGQTLLEDLATGRKLTISAFGYGNNAVFAELLSAGSQ